ncbi:Uncharacterised protein [Yersinia frederiksenii]|nr:Uncharacterised protein [Yersinia frederiksenii]CNJ12827.1 Uncharacterised protein [Yersinia frederiksenii]CNK82280.1 Uncharacterised protein [Yersinia frederiksenii]
MSSFVLRMKITILPVGADVLCSAKNGYIETIVSRAGEEYETD